MSALDAGHVPVALLCERRHLTSDAADILAVILTDTELSGLKTELPDKWEYYIDRLSCHIASTGKQYHSHAANRYKWAQEDAAKGKAAPKQGIPDYSCKEGESL